MLRAAVIGAGYQGRFHALKYSALPGVQLTAVVDIDPQRAARLAAETGAAAYTHHRQVLRRVDVASVAVPVSAHHEVGHDLLEAGVHVLMEKPMARSVAEASELTTLAAARGCVLQIGHLERFSPVVRALRERVGVPRFIEAHRLGPFTARGTDADVVLDLMIHDLDLTLLLVDAAIVRVDANGAPVLSEHVDIANARLTFANGCTANLTASRVSFASRRRLRLFQADAYLSADMGDYVLEWCGRVPGVGPGGRSGIAGSRDLLPRGDALGDQIRAFVRAVRTGAPPVVSGEDGVRALKAALAVVGQITEQSASALLNESRHNGTWRR